ncbi:MAG: alkaline phosphatase D family protein [Verrucomicrobiota bacterium]
MKSLLLIVLLAQPLFALGFANGIKIGELTPTSVTLWTRTTQHAEARNQVPNWTKDNPNWTVPGRAAEVRITLSTRDNQTYQSPWTQTKPTNDFCHQLTIPKLHPTTTYQLLLEAKTRTKTNSLQSTFTTPPLPTTSQPVTFTISTCQEFNRTDDPVNGHTIYASMLKLNPHFFIQTGDTLYYDKPKPFAKDLPTARYKWNRFYAYPNLRTFHNHIPSYWMHDDHDLLKNDCWPGQTYGDLTWDQGVQLWNENIPQSEKPYRTFRWGQHLQIWLPEGRYYRSPNKQPDGPNKTIFGKEQWAWLQKTMTESDATFKAFVSATPVVGPDRKNKNDNHANEGFHHEGQKLRNFLATIPGLIAINGDRHWQYHSIDPVTQIHEFGCGPASDQHAGGWNPEDKRPEHQFLRVQGGFLSVAISPNQATITHHNVKGLPAYSTTLKP